MKICILTTPIRPVPTSWPPLGSMAIIQSLQNAGHEVDFYNIDYHRYSHEQNLNYFTNNKYDAIGVSAVVSTAYAYTKYITKLINKIYPETIIFLGGGMAASSNVLLAKTPVKYCVVGDGEIIVKNLIDALEQKKTSDEELSKIKGITYLDSKNILKFTGYDHPLPAHLLLTPDYKILEKDGSIDHYIDERGNASYNPGEEEYIRTAVVVVAKGCVARCTFCHRWEKGYRVSPTEKVINHILDLKKKYKVGFISIGDENFGSYKKETMELVEKLGSLGIGWGAAGVRAHTVDLEMLKFWKKNGCQQILFGIESGSPTMLKVMEKKITVEQNIVALKAAYDAGLATVVQLVIGMPGETDKTIDETLSFMKTVMKYYPDGFKKQYDFITSINYAQALPGTPLFEYARENGFIGDGSMEAEEEYLINISDKDAYEIDHFINYTQQPLLKVYSWRHKIKWDLWKAHAKENLKLNVSKITVIFGLLTMAVNRLFRLKIKSKLEGELSKYMYVIDEKNGANFFNFGDKVRMVEGLRLLLPWNKYTYPFLCILIAYHETKNIKWFFKLIIEHIVWSVKWSFKDFNKVKLPEETLRKLVKIHDTDHTFELRKGR
ncbi:B12-binding domain-containing radical SAM protein [Candidatus Pelagibacter sp.]|nr:B12-binding domain-containing radical SAM protein [Candidatus Pelagibacter sp.]